MLMMIENLQCNNWWFPYHHIRVSC